MIETWYCQLRNHSYDSAELLPYKHVCGPCAGRGCTCSMRAINKMACDVCGRKHEAKCIVWSCVGHFEEIRHGTA